MAESLRTSDSQQQLVGARPNSGKFLPTPVTVTGVSFVSTMWLTATFLLFAGLVVAAGFPNWLHNEVPPGSGQARDLRTQISQVDLGLFFLYYNYTGNPCLGSFIYGACNSTCRGVWCDAQLYLAYDPPATLVQGGANVSTGLQAPDIRDIAFLFSSSIVYAFGCGMLLVSLFMGVVAYCKPKIKSCPMFLVAFVFQVISGISLIVALVLLPISFGSDFFKQFCGDQAAIYYRGQCTIDWAMFVAMVVTACTLYLPSLAIFSMNVSDGLQAHICC